MLHIHLARSEAKGAFRWNAIAFGDYGFAISMSLCPLYAFGTMNSSAVGRRAILIWFIFWLYQGVFSVVFRCRKEYYRRNIHVFLVERVCRRHIRLAHSSHSLVKAARARVLGHRDDRITGGLPNHRPSGRRWRSSPSRRGSGDDIERIVATHLFAAFAVMAWLFSLDVFIGRRWRRSYLAVTKMKLSLVEGECRFILYGDLSSPVSRRTSSLSGLDRIVARLAPVFAFPAISILGAYCRHRTFACGSRAGGRRSKSRNSDREDPEPPAIT